MAGTIETPISPEGQPPTPGEFAREVLRIVARATGCNASWEQHAAPLTRDELVKVIDGFVALCERAHNGIFERDAKRRRG